MRLTKEQGMTQRSGITAGAILGGLVAIALFVPGVSSAQTDATVGDTVTVTAVGKVEGRPDLASISFGVNGKAETAQGALDQLAQRQQALIAALENLALGEDAVTTGTLTLRENCRYNRTLERTVCNGYVARTTVRAETTDLDQVGEIVDTGVRAGAGSINNVSFERTEDDAAVDEALRQAVAIAQAKATALAEGAGRQLGRVLVIEEGGAQRPRFSEESGLAFSGADFASGISFQPPDEVTRVSIVVTYALN
jgi:uncharacterized protein YggE